MIFGLIKLIIVLALIYFGYTAYRDISNDGWTVYSEKKKTQLKNLYCVVDKSVTNFKQKLGK
jgi:hypothetical protein